MTVSPAHAPGRRNIVPPTNTVNLMKAVGPTRAAAMIGVSTTLLHKAKKDNEINQVIETAASYVLEHLSSPVPTVQARVVRGNDALFLLAVPAEKADTVQRMAAALGGELVPA